ncbi:hypothetical protein SteCoe_14608 [Stentor coeruleus]|uniref:DUF676 domain-containing protein n=1 Tax=Stentor coeruleus TaxID=5963 RepID=A0A1R2C5L9_9CILI|nr:hypothetical protein SteCoe_14608 [Stentor coeruleus]
MRGLYYYDFKVFYTIGECTVYANPYNVHVENSVLTKHLANAPGYIDNMSYKSKTFYIRYCDEDVKIQEVAVFRIEIDADIGFYTELTIECSFMYYESLPGISPRNENRVFKQEAQTQIKVYNFAKGAHQFLPITFDENHACVLNTTIHILPLDFRFRQNCISTDRIQSCDISLYNSLSQYFFGDKTHVDFADIVNVQNMYVKLLYIVIERIKKVIGLACGRNQDDKYGKKGCDEEMKVVERINDTDPRVVARFVMLQIQEAAGKINVLEYTLVNIIIQEQSQICTEMMYKYNDIIKDRWGESIFQTVTQSTTFFNPSEENIGKNHRKIAEKIRNSNYYKELELPTIYIKDYFPHPSSHPLLFLDISTKIPLNKKLWQQNWINYRPIRSQNLHLIIFVHGYQGTSFDLRAIRNQISLFKPNTILMCSNKNEEHTENDIENMGKRLAEEIIEFINEMGNQNRPSKISFIGHSLGGIIIRASLPFLSDFSSKFSFFMTFSSPHLGYMYNSSVIIDAGIWILKKVTNSLCMKQLSMTDSDIFEECLLYKLSQSNGIQWFKNICLVSSYQDNYVPFESARIEIRNENTEDYKTRVHLEMAKNILGKVLANKIYRIDVDFIIKNTGFDKMIGRAAHIQMLDNKALMQMILQCCAIFFEE